MTNGQAFGGLSPRGRGNPLHHCPTKQYSGVYPRVDGGTQSTGYRTDVGTGLSPRGRGTRGTTYVPSQRRGLSPRGRGNQLPDDERPGLRGSIPAWTGEPVTPLPNETVFQGLSPRGRGNARWCSHSATLPGLSPRGRGNHYRGTAPDASYWVYPRVDGGTWWKSRLRILNLGLSPRGRGNRRPGLRGLQGQRSIPAWTGEPAYEEAERRSIPAWTGEPKNGLKWLILAKVYPRVDGGTFHRCQRF